MSNNKLNNSQEEIFENHESSSQELTEEDIIRENPNITQDNSEKTCSELNDEISNYVHKINYDIGYFYWLLYIYSAFWNNISTPINLAITILTALTTGQSASQNLISTSLNTQLGIAVLLLSIFNTFFRPYHQLTFNRQVTKKWCKLGTKFDKLYYNKDYNNKDRFIKLKKLQNLFDEVNLLKREHESNYFIDFFFIILKYIYIRNRIFWKSSKLIKIKNINNINAQTQTNINSNLAESVV